MRDFILSWGFLIAATFFDSYTLYILKWRANNFGKFDAANFSEAIKYMLGFLSSFAVLAGIFSFATGLVLGYVALTRMDITVAYPVSVGLHLLLVIFFGNFFLQESINAIKITATFLIFVGVVLLSIR